MHYVIVILYPSVDKDDVYPIGQPEIVLANIDDVRNYFGLVSCKVSLPIECLYPALPAKVSGALVFTLCRVCADTDN